MNKQCKFQVGKYNCGSYAFNLYNEQIDQGDRCDHHYWQEKAMDAAAHEREECAKICEARLEKWATSIGKDKMYKWMAPLPEAIRARGKT